MIDPAMITPSRTFIAANGTDLPVLGSVRVYADMGRESIVIDGVVSEVVYEKQCSESNG